MRILIVEDEGLLARHVARAMERNGHVAAVAGDGEAALREAAAHRPDLIVLDLNLPGMDGLEVLSALARAGCPARVLILTARGEVESRVRGLKAGADDYLAKPFSMDELLARVEALGRRGTVPTAADFLESGDLRLDVHNRRLTWRGTAVPLSPREFELLRVLMQEPGRVFSRTELCERVWQRDHRYDTRTVEIFITRLRKKLARDAGTVIQTVRGVGYALGSATIA